jgi:predicted NAD/FAD-binding protein
MQGAVELYSRRSHGALQRMQVAVVGSGVAGLSAAHSFALKGCKVTLLEADSHVGGHADTMVVDGVPVDVGFMVFNSVTYPNMVSSPRGKGQLATDCRSSSCHL